MKHDLRPFALGAAISLALTGCAPPSPAVGSGGAPDQTQTDDTRSQRPFAGPVLRHGAQIAAYLERSDTGITFWDAAEGGTALFTAEFPQTLSGAGEAQVVCDHPDLDEDGNSDLTAELTFPDGTTASLLWMFVDGALFYNEEFSRLPGELSAAGDGA